MTSPASCNGRSKTKRIADPALLEGRQARAVRGDLSVQQAVQQALAGSGLQLRVTANGSLTLEPAATDGSVQLGATTVSGNGLGEVTEHSGSYTTGAMASATKLALSPREPPQSVSVVTRQRMDDWDNIGGPFKTRDSFDLDALDIVTFDATR